MAANLKSRLSRLRKGQAAAQGAVRPAEDEGIAALPPFLEGWERSGDFLYSRELFRPMSFPPRIDPLPFLGRGAPAAKELAGTGGLESSALRFFDLETTGLSGGAGTLAFLAAIGRPVEGGMALTQFFLADYPGEADFVTAVLEALGGDSVLVTYNGKAFDLPLLRTRCVMNGLSCGAWGNLDLLHVSRRLWRRVHGGASLGLLEREVLGKDRGPDVPGSRIPALWFAFLKGVQDEEMGLVLSHNAEDVLSLAALMVRLTEAFSSPLSELEGEGLDRGGLGRSLMALAREAEGEALLEAAARAGDEKAGILLSRHYARAGRQGERAKVQRWLGASYEGMIERAKFLEHGTRDYARALAWVDKAARSEGARGREGELARRRERLLRKAGRRKGGQPG
jgi:uncharacterized protein YprB with RNaseH-like and TPR domain